MKRLIELILSDQVASCAIQSEGFSIKTSQDGHNLENMENLENSGNLKNCQNLREKSGKF